MLTSPLHPAVSPTALALPAVSSPHTLHEIPENGGALEPKQKAALEGEVSDTLNANRERDFMAKRNGHGEERLPIYKTI